MRIFRKTLQDEWLITIIFCLILAGSIFLVIQEFAIARNLDFSAFIQNVPAPMQKLAKTFLILNVFGGYLHIVASVNWIIVAGIFVSLVSSSLIAREVEKKTLPIVLAHPVGRFGVIAWKYLAFVFYMALVCIFSFLGFYLGIYHGFINVPYSIKIIARTVINGFAFFLALSGVGLFASVIFSEQKRASISTMLYFFLSYLAFFLGAFSKRWSIIKDLTFFRFFNTEELLYFGRFNYMNCIYLLGICLVLFTISAFIFHKKDISS